MKSREPQTILRKRYRVLDRLGEGGTGTVYRVEDLLAGPGGHRPLALKVVLPEHESPRYLQTLRQEFRILAVLRHPCLARVYDFGRLPAHSGLPGAAGHAGFFMTRELIEGVNLRQYCRDLDVAAICRVCQRTAEVLDVLHRAGMVHGDLKPANIIVSEDGNPHLIDFGLVRLEGQSFGSCGTMPYLAPEILEGESEDRRADLYALGITLYQLLTRQLPMREAPEDELIEWHRRRAPLQASTLREIPDELERIVQRLTDTDPRRRFPTAGEVAEAMAEAAVRAGAPPQEPAAPRFVAPEPASNLHGPLQRLEELVRLRFGGDPAGPLLVSLVGEVGAGKTTLLQELAWRCQLEGIEVIRGELRPGDPRPYGPWQDMLQQVGGVTGTVDPLQQTAVQQTEPFGVFQRVSEYLADAARQMPLLLVLDGVEMAGPESRALLRYLAHTVEGSTPLMILLAHRPDGSLRSLLGQPSSIELEPLAVEDVRRMLEGCSGRDDPELARRIHEHTGGNPMFVVEGLEQLFREAWPAHPDLSRLLPPLGLEERLTRRLRALDQTAQDLLEVMAVVGRSAGRPRLAALVRETGGETSGLGTGLEWLQQQQWIDRGPDGSFRIRQGHLARLVYQRIPPRRRQALHRAVITQLGLGGKRDAVEWIRHCIGAARGDLALETLDRAVARLCELGAHRAAAELVESVLPLAGGEENRLRLQLGQLALTIGDYARAKRELGRVVLEQEQATARIALARALRLTGETKRAAQLLQPVARGDGPTADRIAALTELVEMHQMLEESQLVLDTVEYALELIAARPDPDVVRGTVAQLHGQKALALARLGRHDASEREWARATREARDGDVGRVEANLLNRWAISAYLQGDLSTATRRYGEALACARRIGDVERVAAIQFNLAALLLFKGALAAALEHLPACVKLFEAMGVQNNLASGYANLGHLQRELGLYEQARVTLEQAISIARELGSRPPEALALVNLGLAQAERGYPAEARRHLLRGKELYLELGRPEEAVDALLDLAGVVLAEGDLAEASSVLEQAQVLAGEGPRRPTTARIALTRARLAARRGEHADQPLRAATEVAERAGALQLLWQVRAAAAELARGRGDARASESHARSALRVLEQMATDLPPELQLAFWQARARQEVRRLAGVEAVPVELASGAEGAGVTLDGDAAPDTLVDDPARQPTSTLATVLHRKRVPPQR